MSRILLVEDHPDNRDMLSRRLQRRGYDIITAADGEESVARAREGQPHLILMDIGLPILDGCAATRQIKGDPLTRHIPIIALTAHAMSEDRERALEAGCNDYDTKPVDFARLIGKIETLLTAPA